MKRFTTLCLFFAAFALFVGCSEDEEDFTGTINGIVTDADSGEPMNAVNISLNPGGKSAVTGTDGRYEFLDLEPGQYTVQAAKNDYQTNTKHVTVVAGGTVKADIVLQKATSKLKLTNNSLNFGKNWSALSFGVGNAGITGKIDWRISSDIDWITVSPLSGTTETGKNTEVIVTVLRDKVSGPANGIITISDDGGSLPVYVTVNQDVQAADGENRITVEPENVALLSAYRKDITICSYNSSANYELFVKEEDISWLTFTKTMGILPVYNAEKPNTAVTVGFIADRSGLPAGEYKCTAVLRTGMGDLEIPVSMKVNADGSVDKTFEDFILENYDTDNDGVISDEEAAGVTEIDCSNQGLVSLSGIERFTNLIDLNCAGNRLTELSLKSNVKLKYLRCDENYEMTSLDVSSNTALQSLTCGNNPLGTLDVSKNTELTHLACWNNSLTALDVSNNTKLEVLHCFINQLTDLDISKNLALTNLSFGNNQISSIDISKNTELTELYCTGTTKMQILDISANKKLQSVNCTYNESLTTIYAFSNYAATCTIEKPDATQIIVAGSGDSGNVGDMETVFPDANFRAYVLKNFDADNDGVISDEEAAGVTSIDCSNQGLVSLSGIERFTNLTYLKCSGNQLTELSLKGNVKLLTLRCSENDKMTSLDVSSNTALQSLDCYDNSLGTLDISGNTELTYLACGNNSLTTLDVSNNVKLQSLDCSNNPLGALDVSKNTELTHLKCRDNSLTTLDVSNNTKLEDLRCSSNQLTDLDVSRNLALGGLDFGGNQISSIDISKNTELSELHCTNTKMQILDISANKKLLVLNCIDNESLTTIYAFNNYAATCYIEKPDATQIIVAGSGDSGNVGDMETVFPDANFRAYVLKNFDADNDGVISDEEAADVTQIAFGYGYGDIASLQGIDKFVNLTSLNCYGKQLTTLDVSGCPALTSLSCGKNQLTSLNVSGCTALTTLECRENQLTTLDISGCAALTSLDCRENQLTTLDASGCVALTSLSCYDNQLTILDIRDCIAMDYLSCENNPLTIVYVSNPISQYYVPENLRFVVPGSKIPDPYFLDYCLNNFDFNGDGQISEQEAAEVRKIGGDGQNFIKVTSLEGVELFKNLTLFSGMTLISEGSLDLSNNPMLEDLYVVGKISTLNIDGCTKLQRVTISNVDIASLNLGDRVDLTYLAVVNCKLLESIDVSNCSNLKTVQLKYNSLLKTLNINNCMMLEDIECTGNKIATIDASNRTSLKSLSCENNELTYLSVEGCTALQSLKAQYNQLITLNVTGCEALMWIDCYDNRLSSLDVSDLTRLETLSCYDNQLTSLNINGCTALTSIDCKNNQLTTIGVGGCTNLRKLYCGTNLLTTLDISANKGLSEVNCDDNTLLETIYVFPDYSSTCTIYRRNTNAQIVIKE